MARGQIWQNFPKLLRFMTLFPLFTYGWSLLLAKISLVFFTGRLNSDWCFCLQSNILLGPFYLQFPPPIRKLDLVFFAYGSPTIGKKTNCKQKDLDCISVSKKDASLIYDRGPKFLVQRAPHELQAKRP